MCEKEVRMEKIYPSRHNLPSFCSSFSGTGALPKLERRDQDQAEHSKAVVRQAGESSPEVEEE